MSAGDDKRFEALIQKGLRRVTGDSDAPCPDADSLAAWAERSLPAGEARRLETHFASCERCQEELAGLARIEAAVATDARGAGSRGLWSAIRVPMRWLAPVAVAATAALAILVTTRVPPVERQIVAPAASRPPAAPRESDRVAAAKSAAEPRADLELRKSAPRRSRDADEKKEATTAPGEKPAANVGVATDVLQGAAGEASPYRLEDRAAAPAASAQAPATQSAARMMKLEPSDIRPEGTTSAIRESGSCRIADGRIERSSDSGKTWETADLEDADLLAADAPSADVCWAVGRSGSVLRTTDGQHWERLTLPTAEDLIAVSAESSSTATVTTSAGARLRTVDGGRSWQLL